MCLIPKKRKQLETELAALKNEKAAADRRIEELVNIIAGDNETIRRLKRRCNTQQGIIDRQNGMLGITHEPKNERTMSKQNNERNNGN